MQMLSQTDSIDNALLNLQTVISRTWWSHEEAHLPKGLLILIRIRISQEWQSLCTNSSS